MKSYKRDNENEEGGEEEVYTKRFKRALFFQKVQAWPLTDDLNYVGWLDNFKDRGERKIAEHILDFFIFYSQKMVNQMLRESVSKAGYVFNKHFNGWNHSNFFDKCIYSFIPGEQPKPTDSGYYFTRILREELRIPESQIKFYNEIYPFLCTKKTPTPIIFVDDFVGSGVQINKAWNVNTIDETNTITMSQLIKQQGHCAVYAPLVVNKGGNKVISNDCKDLHLCPTHIIGDDYNLFKKECICWKGDEELYEKGTKLILNKSLEIGIKNTLGLKTTDIRGFHEQGLALSFAHGTPDAVIPLFYWDKNWTPLVRKNYNHE